MKRFRDSKNREWCPSVTITGVKRVRDGLDVDLLSAVEGDLLAKLAMDPILLVDIIYVLCKAECDAQNVSDEEFGGAMSGDVIEAAASAFMENLADFFRPAQREIMRKALGKTQMVMDRSLAQAAAAVEAIDVDELMRESAGNLSGAAPESSESTPAPSPSASSTAWPKQKGGTSGKGRRS